MRYLTVLFALGMQLMYGAGIRSLNEARQCAVEMEALRFVPTPQGIRLPLYWDQTLISYLTQAYSDTEQKGSAVAGPLVLPLYSANPLIFRQGPYVFVTTGLLTQIKDEAELVQAFEKPVTIVAAKRPTQSIRNCGILTVENAAFKPVWTGLMETLSRYEGSTHLHLKRRADESEITLDTTQPQR